MIHFVNTVPVAQVCVNCGAPLEVDEGGACRWCRALIRMEPSPGGAGFHSDAQEKADLVPPEADDSLTLSPMLSMAIVTFKLLAWETPVKEYMHREPRLLHEIQALSVAVSAAGVRVRDAGLLKDGFDNRIELYTPEEIWTLNLACDVIGHLGALDGLTKPTRARVISNLQSLDHHARSHAWKKAIKKAAEGVEGFRELRARTPYRVLAG